MAFLATILAIVVLKPIANKVGLLDIPGGRKDHQIATPLVGGIAIYIGLLIGMLMLPMATWMAYTSFLIAALLILTVGVLDDKHDIPARVRLLAQLVALAIMVFWGQVQLNHLGPLFGKGVLNLGWLGVPLTLFGAATVINAMNMMDGVDGLAGSTALMMLISLFGIAFVSGLPLEAYVLGLVITPLIAFLCFNFPGAAAIYQINTLLSRNKGYQEIIESAINGFENAAQPDSLEDLQKSLESLRGARDSLDIASYPKDVIGYQKIDLAIKLLEAFSALNQGLYNIALDKMSSVKSGQPYFEIAQEGLIELFSAQLSSLHKTNETKEEAETRFNIVQKTLDCLDDNNPLKENLSTILESGRTRRKRVEADLKKPRNPEETSAIKEKGTQECPALFCYSWEKSSLPADTVRPRSTSFSKIKVNF